MIEQLLDETEMWIGLHAERCPNCRHLGDMVILARRADCFQGRLCDWFMHKGSRNTVRSAKGMQPWLNQ